MKHEAPIKCPKCKKTHKVKLNNMRPGRSTICSCGALIKFEGDDMSKASKALDNFQRTINKIGK